jgi:hypothetical protein
MLGSEAILNRYHATTDPMGQCAAGAVVGSNAAHHPTAPVEEYQGGKAGGAVRFEDSNRDSGDLAIFHADILARAGHYGDALLHPPARLLWSLFLRRRDAKGGLPFQIRDYLWIKCHHHSILLSGIPWLREHTFHAVARVFPDGRSICSFDRGVKGKLCGFALASLTISCPLWARRPGAKMDAGVHHVLARVS